MNINQGEQLKKQRKYKKFNQGQHTRKVKYFKKKNRRLHLQKKQPLGSKLLQLSDTIDLIQLENLSLSQQPPMTKKCNSFNIATDTDPTLLLADYSMMPIQDFKEMLLTSSSMHIDTNALKQLLDNEETCLFIRQLTQLVNKLSYSNLQNEQWTYYYNLGISEGIWTGRVSKKMATANSMCHTYGRSKKITEQRQRKYKQQSQQLQSDINEYMQQASALHDMSATMHTINNLIHKDQKQLYIELQRRRTMLQFDAKEHQLVQEFYQLNPRQTEVSKTFLKHYLFYS